MSFSDDFAYIIDLLRKEAPNQLPQHPDKVNFRQMLLVARDVAPEDVTVLRLIDEFALQPVTARTPKVSRASRRVCLIERKDGSEATGVLIGPDLILTAAHALRGTARIFADPSQVTIRFDEFMWNDRTRAEGVVCGLRTNAAGDQPEVVASSIRVDETGRRIVRDNNLDYIIVRLDRMIGWARLPRSQRIRGWMDVHRADVPPTAGIVRVLQHPLGRLLQLSDGNIPVPPEVVGNRPHPPARFPYQTTAAIGTSGAPILNEDNILVGIHVAQTKEEGEQGISWQAIFEDLNGLELEPNPVQAPRPVPLQSVEPAA